MADPQASQAQRQTMVDCQIRTFDVTDQRLITRLLEVPRELFVPDGMRDLAYSDVGLTVPPAAAGEEPRYLLPPLILARLIQGGAVRSTDRVLDIACGTGYSTAVLAGLAADVLALEAGPLMRRDLQARLTAYGLERVRTLDGSLAEGAMEDGLFDVILVNGAVEQGLDGLFEQLADGGRLLTIVRSADDPTGRAAKAICFAKRNGVVGRRFLFDASAPTLPAFAKAPHFVF